MDVNDFDAIRISLASPEKIREWSFGEVLKPETINYRTLRPERDGLFCEKIFGPTKDWECYCGKYKRVRYKGIKCDKCGVEVAPARVRRERMGHIELASPVSHIWYVKGVPSRLGLLLNISPRNLERMLYFAQYIITNVDEDARSRTLQRQERDLALKVARVEGEISNRVTELETSRDERLTELESQLQEKLEALEESLTTQTDGVIGEARSLQSYLETRLGKKVDRDIALSFLEGTILTKGTVVEQKHLSELNQAVQDQLSDIEDGIREDQAEAHRRSAMERDQISHTIEDEIDTLREDADRQGRQMRAGMDDDLHELKSLTAGDLLTESRYYELAERWGNVFSAGMGAEAARDLVQKLDLDAMAEELRAEIRTTRSKQRRKKAAKRLRVVETFRKSNNRPEWMILTVLPVIPPDLRPMVQLDGGRFATSDLNDLYRRVINRNNRLKRLMELGAPDVIVRNEKRMLQEAVDSLIDNGRRGRAISRSGKRKLKSLSDLLKGKHGRFRRNLLGKRVDYSGRSVIVTGPELRLHQCGLPKRMALELFKPFVMRRLVEYNYAHNIKSAKRMVDRLSPEVWDVLEEVTKDRPVLLNRAPTLHRLGIQAFEVVLIEGDAIQIHPLVCAAFNADFDGDQMAVHVPLSKAAVREARDLMLSSHNLLKPASGEPIVGPSKDMILGCYYMTVPKAGVKGEGKCFSSFTEVELAYNLGIVDLRSTIKVWFRSNLDPMPITELHLSDRVQAKLDEAGIVTLGQLLDMFAEGDAAVRALPGIGPKAVAELRMAVKARGISLSNQRNTLIETTVGRVLFNQVLPEELRFVNGTMDKKALNELVGVCYERLGQERTADLVDDVMSLGFRYATQSGMTIAVSDINVPEEKAAILEATSRRVDEIERQYRRGLITEDEQYIKIVELWTRATDDITVAVSKDLDPIDGIGAMATSGATKGGIQPIRQLAGMRGLMADPSGRIIALPIRSNFREGLTALEYFLSTHGARKGLADTALRTADAGYLTRRLVDVAQDVIIREDDCGTRAGVWIDRASSQQIGERLGERAVGRGAISDVVDPRDGSVIVEAGMMVGDTEAREIDLSGVERVYVRSLLTCETKFGICAKCYGRDLARGSMVQIGEAVGTIAAQSIGEPGTQLTLRTFHTGGVAGGEDITQGLPRVEELFEARTPKGEAVIADLDGRVDVYWDGDQRKIKITNTQLMTREHVVPKGYEQVVADGDRVQEDTIIARNGEESALLADLDGTLYWEEIDGRRVGIVRREDTEVVEYDISPSARLRAERGQQVTAGEQLTEGSKNPKEILRILGRDAVQAYLVEEVQRVYRSQGVNIHDKYIEIIVRQMLRKINVRDAGNTEFLPGELIDRFAFETANQKAMAEGRRPASGETVLLGITKAALNTESFLAAASFQETTRVLTEAAVKGSYDELRGLKENVIIGKLIPVGTGFRTERAEPAESESSESMLLDMDMPNIDLADVDYEEDVGFELEFDSDDDFAGDGEDGDDGEDGEDGEDGM